MKTTSKPPDQENDAANETAANALRHSDAPQHGWTGRFQVWKDTLAKLLDRAEKRITDNFRVPPGGG